VRVTGHRSLLSIQQLDETLTSSLEVGTQIDQDLRAGLLLAHQSEENMPGTYGATVAYYTLRTYVVSHRAAKPPDKID
jgi:hypothetical protein